jgi:MFS family permease
MVSLLKEIALDSKKNFLLLFKKQEEKERRVVFIDQSGKEQVYTELAIDKVGNPIQLVRSVPARQWMFFFCGFLVFFVEILDMYLVVMQMQRISASFHTVPVKIAEGEAYAAFVKPIGAVVSGTLADFYGRKYPMLANLLILTALQMASIYCTTIDAFIGVRTVMGFSMGGLWGCSAAVALDGCPIQARGMMSGMFASAGSLASVAASCIVLSFGLEATAWKSTFWVSVGITLFAALVRLAIPESRQHAPSEQHKDDGQNTVTKSPLRGMAKARYFLGEFKLAMKTSWKRFVYMILFASSAASALQVAVSAEAQCVLVCGAVIVLTDLFPDSLSMPVIRHSSSLQET